MIKNGSSNLLNETFSNLPQLRSALNGWFRPMTFTKIVKTVVNYLVVETETDINFRGVWQAFGAEELKIVPEGQRSWSWWQVHSDTALDLNTDEIISYQQINYRVMKKIDHEGYGYFEYHVIRDYQDAPT